MRRLAPLVLVAVAASLPLTAGAIDPNGDRVGLLPTALTHNAGQGVFNDYELFFVQGTYAITDNVQISAGGMIPITTEVLLGQLGAKMRFLDLGPLKLALSLNTFFATSSGQVIGTASATPVLTYCLDGTACDSLVNVALSVSGAFGSGGVGFITQGFLLTGGAGIVYKVGGAVKIIAEVSTAGASANGNFEFARAAAVTYGLRFFGDNIAGDVGFIRAFGEGLTFDILPLGIPVVNFSYRFGG